MLICRRSRVLLSFGAALAALAALRCGPPETCLRNSDCKSGFVCGEGVCVVDTGDDITTSAREGGASDSSVAETGVSTPVDSGSTAMPDAGTKEDAAVSPDAETPPQDAGEEPAPEF